MLTPFNPVGQGGFVTGPVAPARSQFKSTPATAQNEASPDQVSLDSKAPQSFPTPMLSYPLQHPPTLPQPANDNPAPAPAPADSGANLISTKNPLHVVGASSPFDVFTIDLNNPLVMLVPEQCGSLEYTEKLSHLNVRYPGLSVKLRNAEARAWIVSNASNENGGPRPNTQAVVNNPPWPNGRVGSSRERIQNKAAELAAAHPKLASNRAEDYDFQLAQDRAEDLFATISDLFPEKEFEGAQFATRAKTPQSLENKLAKRTAEDENFSLAHLTDSVGARIDCRSLKMLGDAASKLEKHFEGKIVAKDDYLSQPGALGYRALHYVVDLGDRMAEIQLSTHDLRATDLATHDTLYKPMFQVDEATAQKLQGSADRVMEAECFRCLCGYR
ncbi:hypothetical protein JST97_38615 [bacterium]|nr:hypothetical protein [bacterium]